MYKYNEFSIESALNSAPEKQSVKLSGMNKVAAILNNPSRSTEEYIAGAISSLGQADRTIMYTTLSLEALDDRLALAAKIARPVNQAKARGVEGFNNVPYLNPWEYAIEGKVGDFFKKVWDAIVTICHKILEAITQFIKFVGNAIASIGTKKQAKDRDQYMRNRAVIEKKVKAAKVNDMEMNSLPWKVNADRLSKLCKSLAAKYVQVIKENQQDEAILNGVSRLDMKAMTTEADAKKMFHSVFGVTGLVTGASAVASAVKGEGAAFGAAKVKVNAIKDSINKQIEEGIKLMGGTKATSPKEVVASAVVSDATVGKVKIGKIVDLAGKDFGVLSNEWLAVNVKDTLGSVHAAEKQFTKYTKTIETVAKRFDKIQGASHPVAASLSKLTAELAKARTNLNSFYSGLIIELTSYILRFRKTCHIALKAYLRVGYGSKIVDKNASEEKLQSIESMFTF